MNDIIIKNFIRKISDEEALKILDDNKDNKEIGLITEWGAVTFDETKFIVELGEENGDNYIASIGMLDRSKDGVFCKLKHDINEPHDDNIPEFKDVFKIKEFK